MPAWPTPRARLARFAAFSAAVILAFAGPLAALIRLALNSRLYSHALIVPAISAWLAWRGRRPLPAFVTSARAGAALLSAAAALAAAAALCPPGTSDALGLRILAMLSALAGGWMLFLGRPAFRALLFPLLFLLFIVPLPTPLERLLNAALRDGSAALAHWTFAAMGWPVYRSEYVLTVPGLSLEVAEECSGINSTYALFITGVLAGRMLLNAGPNRILFAGAVIPLGILRNSFRIVSLAVLTLKVDARVLDSPLHHQGGPIYFALSLAPLFALLLLLRRRERVRNGQRDRKGNRRDT
ncbi:MAG: exosortase [Lentisphaerae bacterium]|nr:exosortase [Lentisphaerota bacterium]